MTAGGRCQVGTSGFALILIRYDLITSILVLTLFLERVLLLNGLETSNVPGYIVGCKTDAMIKELSF